MGMGSAIGVSNLTHTHKPPWVYKPVMCTTHAIPTRFQVLGQMVDRTVHTHHNHQKYVCYGHQDGYLWNFSGSKNSALPIIHIMIPVSPPTFSLPSCTAGASEVPCDTSASHVPLGLHMIHLHALSCLIPCNPISHPWWLRLQESPSPPSTSNVPRGLDDLWINAITMEKPILLCHLVKKLLTNQWSTMSDLIDTNWYWPPLIDMIHISYFDLTAPIALHHYLLHSSFHSLILSYVCLPCSLASVADGSASWF